MCIRDRYTGANKYTGQFTNGLYALVAKSGFISNYNLDVTTSEAVSYTHLDVYKRQPTIQLAAKYQYTVKEMKELLRRQYAGYHFGERLTLSLIHI